jgi:hypothetical protein
MYNHGLIMTTATQRFMCSKISTRTSMTGNQHRDDRYVVGSTRPIGKRWKDVEMEEWETGRARPDACPARTSRVEARPTDWIRNVGPDFYCDAYLNIETASRLA